MQTGRKGSRLAGWGLLAAAAVLLAGCAARGPLYLQPGRGAEAPAGEGRPLVQLELFREDFARNEVVGGQFFAADYRELRIRKNEVAGALRRMIGRRLAEEKIPFAYGQGWDLSPSGLERVPPPLQMVVGGQIKKLWLDVKTGMTHTTYHLEMEIVCHLGVVSEKKVVSRSVQVAEEVIKFSSQTEAMEVLLDEGLAEAARQVFQKIGELKKSYPILPES